MGSHETPADTGVPNLRPDAGVPPARMRVGDAERDAVARRLATALQEGRLTLAEYHERLDLALAAVVAGDLEGITSDLPEPPEPPPDAGTDGAEAAAERARRARHRRLDPWRGLTAVSIVLLAIWAVTSVMADRILPFWPLVPIGFMFVFTLAATVGALPFEDEEEPR
ncbi:DUF1707 SHOCT-like domain-containing protein [Nocardiopsis coralliicola]